MIRDPLILSKVHALQSQILFLLSTAPQGKTQALRDAEIGFTAISHWTRKKNGMTLSSAVAILDVLGLQLEITKKGQRP